MNKLTTFIMQIGICSILAIQSKAQNFLQPFDMFSGKKTAYINLEDGSKLEGIIKDIDRKKGLIEEITIIDASNKKTVLKPEQIKDMYLPPSDLSKFNNAMEKMYEVENWDKDNTLEREKLKEGYAYFEKCEVIIKKNDTRKMMMQLLNPSFCNKVKVYHDPLAQETGGLVAGGFKITGGDDKSYFISIRGAKAYKLFKKKYDDDFSKIYEDCPDFVNKNSKKIKWGDFEKHLYNYTKECK